MNLKGDWKSIMTDLITAMFILLFAYAAFNKLMDYQKFEVQLGKSPVLAGTAHLLAWLVPGIEVLVVVALMIPRLQLTALYLSFSLMVMFSTYIVLILKFSSYVPCSCGGIIEDMNWPEHLVFNLVFVLLGFTGLMLYPASKNLLANERESLNPEETASIKT